MNTTAQKAYTEVSRFTADDMARLRYERDANLAEVIGTVAVVALCAGFFLGMFFGRLIA